MWLFGNICLMVCYGLGIGFLMVIMLKVLVLYYVIFFLLKCFWNIFELLGCMSIIGVELYLWKKIIVIFLMLWFMWKWFCSNLIEFLYLLFSEDNGDDVLVVLFVLLDCWVKDGRDISNVRYIICYNLFIFFICCFFII